MLVHRDTIYFIAFVLLFYSSHFLFQIVVEQTTDVRLVASTEGARVLSGEPALEPPSLTSGAGDGTGVGDGGSGVDVRPQIMEMRLDCFTGRPEPGAAAPDPCCTLSLCL